MRNLEPISTKDISYDINKMFSQELALLTVKNGDKINTMTIGWGSIGYIWKKDVLEIYVRPSRYTYELLENADCYSVSFFDISYKDKLLFCGKNSGRDVDKFTACNFDVENYNNVPYIAQARLVAICKKLYTANLDTNNFEEEYKYLASDFYKDGDIHKIFIGEITSLLG
ncbi:MAG: flavin reductase family protein [Oscillospiraceae bacterium]